MTTRGAAGHDREIEQVERLRRGPLAHLLDIPEHFERGNDAHLEQVAGQLLEHFRKHDDVDAYVALVELTQGRLLQVAVGVTRRLALLVEPDDLVAAFMARLFTDVRKPRAGGPVRRFLALAYTMMRFDALNQLRLLRRSRERGIRFEEREARRREPVDPAQAVAVREGALGLPRLGTLLLAVVGSCFHDLRTRDRRILICREVEGLSYDEIAVAMDVPRAQVGMILKRARERLAERIDRALPAHAPEQSDHHQARDTPRGLASDPDRAGRGPRVTASPRLRARFTTEESVR